MKRKRTTKDELRPEYDLKKLLRTGVQGKYVERFRKGGRIFSAEEEEPGKDLVVVLGHGFWQRRFGADPNTLGKSISLSDRNRTVIGVMPPNFKFPDRDDDVYLPLALDPNSKARRAGLSGITR